MKKACLRKQGFTFIEILVVITIIGVLTLVATTNFAVVNKKARDGKRQGDLEQIKVALEMYRTDVKAYPDSSDWTPDVGSDLVYDSTTYIDDIPGDPKTGLKYFYWSNSITFELCVTLELSGGVDSCSKAWADCNGVNDCNYGVTNPL